MKTNSNFKQQNKPMGIARLSLSILKAGLILCMVFLPFSKGMAQVKTSSELFQTLEKLDGILFVNGFNKCQYSEMEPLISKDLEFYHDQGGLSLGKAEFFKTIKQNICSNWEKKPIRKLVEGSLEVFPLYSDGKIYGAIQKGLHEFYIKEPNKAMYLTSTAKFTHVWLVKNNHWQIKRILSYDHQAPQKASKTEIALSSKVLKTYVGQYEAPNTGTVIITKNDIGLEMNAGEMRLELLPQTKTLFFNKQMPLTFEFVTNAKGKISKMIIRENGNIVEEAKRVK